MSAAPKKSAGAGNPTEVVRAARRSGARLNYPHRVSLDVDDDSYQWLQWATYEHRLSSAELLRGLITAARHDDTVLDAAVRAGAKRTPPPPPPGN